LTLPLNISHQLLHKTRNQLAVRLLQLRTLARSAPDSPANTVVPALQLKVLIARLGLQQSELTLHQFWHAVARLGGFLGRQSDGNPG